MSLLARAGVRGGIAVAGTLVVRVTMLLGSVVFGYLFYQLTIVKYGKNPV